MTSWTAEEMRNAARSANSTILEDAVTELLRRRRECIDLRRELDALVEPIVLVVRGADSKLARKLRALGTP